MEIGIRQFSESDAQAFYAAVVDSASHISQWLSWCTHDYSMEDAIQWISSAAQVWEKGTDYRFVIESVYSGEILGSVGINQVVPQHKVGNLGYWVRTSALGQGVCTQAARLAIKYAFRSLGFQRIEIHVHPDNSASNRVASKLGGMYEGTFRNKIILSGVSSPAKCYSVIPSDYDS
ncbi:GNAT family N-acetyltransferase [Agarilytica rhodophyticola]|uniref:GNAT family N-acetyltransferase n=1 Tax=Agarilytica rhodophyticola TaxID=1737490 RepID=UPI001319E5C3|nr:GNAT family N-acetyltransferase [Agarilytica rhodophyticola]